MFTVLFATAAVASKWLIVSDVLLAAAPACAAIQHYLDTKED